jgi:hypothetical protein
MSDLKRLRLQWRCPSTGAGGRVSFQILLGFHRGSTSVWQAHAAQYPGRICRVASCNLPESGGGNRSCCVPGLAPPPPAFWRKCPASLLWKPSLLTTFFLDTLTLGPLCVSLPLSLSLYLSLPSLWEPFLAQPMRNQKWSPRDEAPRLRWERWVDSILPRGRSRSRCQDGRYLDCNSERETQELCEV